jgi:hypothetical protein
MVARSNARAIVRVADSLHEVRNRWRRCPAELAGARAVEIEQVGAGGRTAAGTFKRVPHLDVFRFRSYHATMTDEIEAVKETAKAVQEVAKTGGKVIDAGRSVGGFLVF